MTEKNEETYTIDEVAIDEVGLESFYGVHKMKPNKNVQPSTGQSQTTQNPSRKEDSKK